MNSKLNIFICCWIAAGIGFAKDTHPLPSYLPQAPDKNKLIENYTAADVMGCMFTSGLPADHKFNEGKSYSAGIKAKWPGAKSPTQIDVILQVALDAPLDTNKGQLDSVFESVRYLLMKVMDVSDTAKADAVIRVVEAQSNAVKKERAKEFATQMFPDVLDARLLDYLKSGLDDASLAGEIVSEGDTGDHTVKITVRADSRDCILAYLREYVQMNINTAPFKVGDEAAGCAALKVWMTANASAIATKCAQLRANPQRELPPISPSLWDPRANQ